MLEDSQDGWYEKERESFIDRLNFDAVIDNHGTLIQLKNQVQDHLVSSELLASA